MILMDLFRVLDKEQLIEIRQDDNNGGVSFICKPDNIPAHLLDTYVDKLAHGEVYTIVKLCS